MRHKSLTEWGLCNIDDFLNSIRFGVLRSFKNKNKHKGKTLLGSNKAFYLNQLPLFGNLMLEPF
ncbi:hypothetical protein SAMN05192533_10252 [Mesobacillus persicus]|uniref:Uncharacterized protein n=1 Tax=Mesobacillus persicus TaxID=930146 RepID=A0A1H7X4X0_9BACI|nr:hypothetical protein SAMN05192533_10252 [Mesobacillus persicus]